MKSSYYKLVDICMVCGRCDFILKSLAHNFKPYQGHSGIAQGTGASFKYEPIDKLIHHMKDNIEIEHLSKFDAFRSNRDEVHTNVSNFGAASLKLQNHINSSNLRFL